jgi:DNA-binding response OmpR family regulator
VAEALAKVVLHSFNLIMVDSELAGADRLIAAVRANAATRAASIVVMAHGDFSPEEVRLMEAGANAILRFPVGPEWDDRLSALVAVPQRRASRLAVQLQLEANAGEGITVVAGTVLNISEHGMLVETDIELPLWVDIDFKIHLRDIPQPLLGCGQIVREAGTRRCGVRFYGLEADGAARVQRFVKAAK